MGINSYTSKQLCEAGLVALRTVLRQVIRDIEDDPENFLSPVTVGKSGKPALRVDVNAEDQFERKLHSYRSGAFANISFLGEERLKDPALDLSGRTEDFVLVDAVDGTDLLERDLSNWCSAAVFFSPSNPPGKRIKAALIGLPTGEIYFTTDDDDAVYVQRAPTSKVVKVSGTSKVCKLADASICFYGQKLNYLLKAMSLFQGASAGEHKPFRIYNLAGMPMMVKLIDHRVRDAHGIDLVFEMSGQQPHDVVPGAYLALKAGATLQHLNGDNISLLELEQLLLRPASGRLKYVLGSTPDLCAELLAVLAGASAQKTAEPAKPLRPLVQTEFVDRITATEPPSSSS